MGILDFLFGKAKKPYSSPVKAEKAVSAVISDSGLFEIPKLGIFVEFSKSPSRQWVICWRDSNDQGNRGGHRESGKGSYVLYSTAKQQVVLKGKLERPNSGCVADNGTFSIEDWGFGGKLSGTFYVFSSSGSQLIKKTLEAKIFNSAMSSSGRYAVCQTANNPVSGDGNKLIAFDVEGNKQLFSVSPGTGWADEYRFLEEGPYFCVKIKDVGTFRYDKTGKFIDREEFELAKLNCRRHDLVLLSAENILKAIEFGDQRVSMVLEAILRARSMGADNDPNWKSMALKLQGLCHELLGNEERALEAFDEALKINPKVGVKRKADTLRKKLTGHGGIS